MQRRLFLKNSALSTLGVGLFGSGSLMAKDFFGDGALSVNTQRIEGRVAALANFGKDANGHG